MSTSPDATPRAEPAPDAPDLDALATSPRREYTLHADVVMDRGAPVPRARSAWDAKIAAGVEAIKALADYGAMRVHGPGTLARAVPVALDFIAAIPALVADAAEAPQLREYAALLERGLSAHEARETVWPSSAPDAPRRDDA